MLLAASNSGGSGFSLLIMMALVIGVAYFLMIRPQQKRARAVSQMQSAIGPGDEISTIGGLVGTVDSIDDQFVYLQIAPEVVVKYRRQAIASVVSKASDDDADDLDGLVDADQADRAGDGTVDGTAVDQTPEGRRHTVDKD